ncbi:MAG TPA: hypothetical protein VIA06_06890 [Candidatus Dormibacteraeota bacterium]|nr:hypothetical protein [Candidatus Dormibacteraeota bacterium]
MSDRLHEAAEALLHRIDAIAEEGGWDQPPRLYAVVTPDRDEASEQPLRAIEVHQFMDLSIEGNDTLDVLGALVDAFRRRQSAEGRVRLPEGFYGWAVLLEAWMLRLPEGAMEPGLELGQPLEEHPDRIEVRLIYCTTVDAEVIGLSRERGFDPELVDPDHIAEDGGRVPSLMRELADLSRQEEVA